jgi:hypothetical protein
MIWRGETVRSVVAALALAAGTATASAAVMAANAARGFRRDILVDPPVVRTVGAAAHSIIDLVLW